MPNAHSIFYITFHQYYITLLHYISESQVPTLSSYITLLHNCNVALDLRESSGNCLSNYITLLRNSNVTLNLRESSGNSNAHFI